MNVPTDIRRQHSDDFIRLIIYSDLATDYRRISAESTLPKIVANHDNVWRAVLPFVWRKRSALNGLYTQEGKKICGYDLSRHFFGFAVTRKIAVEIKKRGHVGEDFVLIFPVEKVTEVNHILRILLAALPVFPNNCQPLTVFIRQRPEQ